MTENPTSTHLPRDEVEAYLAGELSAERETEVEEHLADCDLCTRMARELFASDPAFEEQTRP